MAHLDGCLSRHNFKTKKDGWEYDSTESLCYSHYLDLDTFMVSCQLGRLDIPNSSKFVAKSLTVLSGLRLTNSWCQNVSG